MTKGPWKYQCYTLWKTFSCGILHQYACLLWRHDFEGVKRGSGWLTLHTCEDVLFPRDLLIPPNHVLLGCEEETNKVRGGAYLGFFYGDRIRDSTNVELDVSKFK